MYSIFIQLHARHEALRLSKASIIGYKPSIIQVARRQPRLIDILPIIDFTTRSHYKAR